MIHRRLIPILVLAILAVALSAGAAGAARRHVPQGFLGVNLSGPMLDPGVANGGEFSAMTRAMAASLWSE